MLLFLFFFNKFIDFLEVWLDTLESLKKTCISAFNLIVKRPPMFFDQFRRNCLLCGSSKSEYLFAAI